MQEEDLKCALCLDFFTAPVRITKCGHNFCQQCLTEMVPAGEATWPCPECRTEQNQAPEEQARNFFLEKTVEKFLSMRETMCAAHGSQKKLRKFFYSNRFLRFHEFSPMTKLVACQSYQYLRLLQTQSTSLS